MCAENAQDEINACSMLPDTCLAEMDGTAWRSVAMGRAEGRVQPVSILGTS